MSHLKGEDPLAGGVASGVGASIGYGVGKVFETPLNGVFNPNWKNYEWVDLGFGISKSLEASSVPSTVGNVINSGFSEPFSDATNKVVKEASHD